MNTITKFKKREDEYDIMIYRCKNCKCTSFSLECNKVGEQYLTCTDCDYIMTNISVLALIE